MGSPVERHLLEVFHVEITVLWEVTS
jgi:hypothetical protein